MSITINGNGTITGISVGGLPDGIVDTDMLATNAVATAKIANNAVTSAKTSEFQRRTISSPVSLNGAGDHIFNLTSGVRSIEIIFENASAGNSNMLLQLRDAGGTETSGYGYASGLHRATSTGREGSVTNFTSGYETYGLDADSYKIWGTWKLWNPTGNTWVAEHIFWGSQASDHTFYGNGYKVLSDTITGFNIAAKSGTFDSGSMTVIQTMGDT